ncbi:hypothetical protein TWF679_000176 [Orbilia oligospora]|uniref:Uncharacterized protein n=1 Tax=Orbilia oligospora TaxID=2813651 RepID=A0A8H8VNA0_ORBOL|nr:hypothetical protein TWF679_000176 [Orbilia oligospora]
MSRMKITEVNNAVVGRGITVLPDQSFHQYGSQVDGGQPSSPLNQPQEAITPQPGTPPGAAPPLLCSDPPQIFVRYIWRQPYGKIFHDAYISKDFCLAPRSNDILWDDWINGHIPPFYEFKVFTNTQKSQVRYDPEASVTIRISRVSLDLRFRHEDLTIEDSILPGHETTIEVCLKVKPVISSTFVIMDVIFKLALPFFPLAEVTGLSSKVLNYVSCVLSLLAFCTDFEETY